MNKGPGEVRCSLQLLTSCVVQQGLAGTAHSPTTEVPGLALDGPAGVLGQRFLLVEVGWECPESSLHRFLPTVK